MKTVSIRFFGRFELQSPSVGRDHLSGTKTLLLLARLTMPPGQACDRKRLTELLWPDRGEAQALASLRQSLWSLRKALGDGDPEPIVAERSSIRLDPALVDIDTAVFERLIRSGGKDNLEQAANLYRGDFLADVDLEDEEALTPFRLERDRLRELGLSGLKSLVDLRAKAGDLDGAVDIAQRALSFDPLQEDVHATIIRLHRDRGRLGLARDQYDACRALLRRELDVAPSAEIEALRKSLGVSSVPVAPQEITLRPKTAAPDTISSPTNLQTRLRSRLAFLVPGTVAIAALMLAYVVQSSRTDLTMTARPVLSDERPSLVVLPFEDISVDNQQALFAAGLTDDLITDLSKVSALFVIASETSRSMDSESISVQQKAEALGVDFAVTGTVRQSRGMVRVTVQLLRAGTGTAVWAERYDRQATDVFNVQDEVVQRIAASLEIELTDQERRTITRIPTDNLEAHDFYLRAEYPDDGVAESDSILQSIAAYRRAIELDPDFAEAYAGYARVAVTVWRRDFSHIMSSAVAKQEAYSAAGKALELDPENARAYEVLSIIQAVEGEHHIAIDSARAAVDLQPNDAEAHTNLATIFYFAGDLDAAASQIDLARRLNPALSTDLRLVSGTVAFAQGRYTDAITEFNAVKAYLPRSELVLEHLAAAYAYLGDVDGAAITVAELEDIFPTTNLSFYGILRQNIGSAEQTARFIEGLRRAGIPEWPFNDQRKPEDRLSGDELRSVAAGPVWTGQLENSADFVQFFDRTGGFAYRSTSSLLSGRVEIQKDRLCQIIEGYLLNYPSCGYVYRSTEGQDPPGNPFVYVSADAIKYFSVSN